MVINNGHMAKRYFCLRRLLCMVCQLPAVARDPAEMVSELTKFPKFLPSAVSIVTGLNMSMKGFWFCLNWSVIEELTLIEPSSIE